MDDIDKILLFALSEIGFEIPDDIENLKQCSFDQLIEMVIFCLNTIQPNLKFPSSLPPLMSAKFNLCARIAQACLELGFKGEIGYHTFLYAHTSDIRNVLIFLVEHLPKKEIIEENFENSKITIRQRTKKVLQELLNKPELASNHLEVCKNPFISMFLETGILLPNQKIDCKPLEWKNFVAEKLPFIDEQLLDNNIYFLPSVISLNSAGLLNPLKQKCSNLNFNQQNICFEPCSTINFSETLQNNKITFSDPQPEFIVSNTQVFRSLDDNDVTKLNEVQLQKNVNISNGVKEMNITILNDSQNKNVHIPDDLQNELRIIVQEIATLSTELDKVTKHNEDLKKNLREKNTQKLSLEKSLLLLSNYEDNIPKLQAAKEKCEQKIQKLELQWKQHKQSLLNKRTKLKSQSDKKMNEKIDLPQQFLKIRSEINDTIEETKKREAADKRLRNLHLIEGVKRDEYTRRILEIIKSINKQDQQIENIFKDTKSVQQRVNNLTGKIDELYTSIEELIKSIDEDFSRETYKLLVTLHRDVADILTMISEIGHYFTDIKDLEDEVNENNNNNIEEMLNQVVNDLKNVQEQQLSFEKEIQMLTNKGRKAFVYQ